MIRFAIKDFSVKKQSYVVQVIHHSGMIVELELGMTESTNKMLDKLNQAVALAEVNMAMAFYGVNNNNGQKPQLEAVPEEALNGYTGDERKVSEVEA